LFARCDFCNANVAEDCEAVDENLRENQYQMQSLTQYGTELEYKCSLGKAFLIATDQVEDSYNLTCQWNQTWSASTVLPECVCEGKSLF